MEKHEPMPSPGGSVNSRGSHTSTSHNQEITIPEHIYTTMKMQLKYLNLLKDGHNCWNEAKRSIEANHRGDDCSEMFKCLVPMSITFVFFNFQDFFADLDAKVCKLTVESQLETDLAKYMQAGIEKLLDL